MVGGEKMRNLITPLTIEEEKKVTGGEIISIAAVAAVLAIGILTIVIWKMYTSSKGQVDLPGGFRFEWSTIRGIVSRASRFFR